MTPADDRPLRDGRALIIFQPEDVGKGHSVHQRRGRLPSQHWSDQPSASLEGNYQFRSLGVYPVNEIDSVTLQTSIDNGGRWAFSAAGSSSTFRGVGGSGSTSVRFSTRFDVETLVNTRSRPSTATPSGATRVTQHTQHAVQQQRDSLDPRAWPARS